MQKSIWKLAALAGVVGVGFLGVMQAQRGLSKPDGETAQQQQQLEDFDAPGPGAEDDGAPAVELGQSEETVGFGQFEPAADPGNAKSGSSKSARPSGLEVADANLNAKSPEAFDATSGGDRDSAPAFTEIKRRRPATSEDSGNPFGGLDFRNDAPAPQDRIAEAPQTASTDANPTSEENPLGFGDDEFQPQAKAESPSPSNDNTSPAKTGTSPPLKEGATPGVVRMADGNIGHADHEESGVKQASRQEQLSPDAPQSADAGGNPFAEAGPRLLDPSANARPMKNNGPADSRTRPMPLQVADTFGTAEEPGTSDEEPFKQLPPFGAADEKPQPAELPMLEAPGQTGTNDAPAEESLSPFPDPSAFEDQPKDTTPSKSGDAPFDENPPLPTPEPFADEPADTEPVPLPTAEPIDEGNSGESAPQESLPREDPEPNQLQPTPKAVRLVAPTEDDLAGDATVGADAPRGPQRPQLSIVKQAPPNAVLGEPMIYSIIVKNVGNSPAAQVTVEDRIPRGTRLTGTIPQAEMYKKTLIWKIGTLKPQQERKIQVRVIPVEAGQIGSIATVNFVAEVAAQTLVSSPSLNLDLVVPQQASVGGRVDLKFKVTNNGASPATGVVLRNVLPSQLSHPGGQDLEYEVGELAAGETKNVSLQLTAAQPGLAVNKAVVTADGNLTAEASASLKVVGSMLKLSRSGPKRRYLGRPAVYVNHVTNTANGNVGPVTVVEKIPAGLNFVKATEGGQFNQVDRTVAWRIERLAAGETKDVSVELTATAKGVQDSEVTATGPAGGVRVESQTEVVGLAALSANMSGITGPIPVGETVTLQVRIANRGNEPASAVKVSLTLPEHLQFVTSQGPATATTESGTVNFSPLQAIGPQKEQTLTIVLKAIRSGEARLKVQIEADQLTRPLTRDDAIVIFGDGP